MTGAAATIGSVEGEPFSIADGQIKGRILEAEPYHRIAQVWKAEEGGMAGWRSNRGWR